jgi:hypothetical protein
VARLYDHAGPFATAYLDATRATERGPEGVRLQWRALRGELSAAGADEATLTGLDAAVDDDWTPGEHGHVLVGAGGETLLNATLPKAPIHPRARWAPLPHVMPYLAQLGPRIAHVVVVADRAGADVLAATAEMVSAASPSEPTYAEPQAGEGSHDDPLHMTSTADWPQRHFQQRIENTWAANAHELAALVARLVTRVGASLVILAGDGRVRALLRADLPPVLSPHVEIVDVSDGGRDNGWAQSAQIEAIHSVLLQRGLREREQTLERLRVAQAHDIAAQGLAPVIDALRRAQVDTLVFVDQPTSRVHCWVGPRATQLARGVEELKDLGVASPQPDRLDAAMVRALAGTSAELLTVPPEDLSLPDSIADVLRSADDARP